MSASERASRDDDRARSRTPSGASRSQSPKATSLPLEDRDSKTRADKNARQRKHARMRVPEGFRTRRHDSTSPSSLPATMTTSNRLVRHGEPSFEDVRLKSHSRQPTRSPAPPGDASPSRETLSALGRPSSGRSAIHERLVLTPQLEHARQHQAARPELCLSLSETFPGPPGLKSAAALGTAGRENGLTDKSNAVSHREGLECLQPMH